MAASEKMAGGRFPSRLCTFSIPDGASNNQRRLPKIDDFRRGTQHLRKAGVSAIVRLRPIRAP
jgi:hypothetical protein